MYPSTNNSSSKPQSSNYYNENFYLTTPQELCHTPSSSPFDLLPSPIYVPLEDEAICELFQQHQFLSNDHNHNILAHMSNNVDFSIGECCNNNGQFATNNGDHEHCNHNTHLEVNNACPREKPSGRDRHSKINTARGPRDRRMRLSLDVAKRFFRLQDLLGYDKASTTIDWLLTKSKTAILDLLPDRKCSFMDVSNSTSSTSECEVVSRRGGQFMVKTGDDQATTKDKSSQKQKQKVTRVRKCVDIQHPFAKETRVRARQRARERTIEKQNNYKHGVVQNSTYRPFLDNQLIDEDVNHLGSWNTLQESQHQSIDQRNQMSSNFSFNQGLFGDNG